MDPISLLDNGIVRTIGVLLAPAGLVCTVGFALVVAGIEGHVRVVEEPYLRRVHGDRYRDHTAEVGRFVPLHGRTAR